MRKDKLQWKKSPHNHLPTLWDGDSSWCVCLFPTGEFEEGSTRAVLRHGNPTEPFSQLVCSVEFHLTSESRIREVLEQVAASCVTWSEAVRRVSQLAEYGILKSSVLGF